MGPGQGVGAGRVDHVQYALPVVESLAKPTAGGKEERRFGRIFATDHGPGAGGKGGSGGEAEERRALPGQRLAIQRDGLGRGVEQFDELIPLAVALPGSGGAWPLRVRERGSQRSQAGNRVEV